MTANTDETYLRTGRMEPGRLCPRSFASKPTSHVAPHEAEGWGVCVACGEVVSTRGPEVPEHRVPA